MCIEYDPLTHRHLLDVQAPITFPQGSVEVMGRDLQTALPWIQH